MRKMCRLQRRCVFSMTVLLMLSFCIKKAVAQEQTHEYIPFVEEGKVWYCGYCHPYDDFPATDEDPSGLGIDCVFTMSGDTLIDGRDYKKVYCQFEEYYSDKELHYYCAVREADYQVFIIENKATEEKLLYDFSRPDESISLTHDKYEIARERGSHRFYFLPGQYMYGFVYSYDECYFNNSWVEGVGAADNNPFSFEYILDKDVINKIRYQITNIDELIFGTNLEVRSCIKEGKTIFEDFWMDVPGPDESTGISSVNSSTTSSPFFDLQGRPVKSTPKHGVYIKEGRKVIK
ncbi:hypothetical protein [Prevotella sp. E2-28]|uniref:hypothetical protein n=1 Tax=Prevotella sp. E2-28 TaxID=2913620 RepID=UPI001EDC22A5|nr:hypothetical protein [Prevotella sp. E2-28]UKK53823.1 hypothetical protein L6465_00690 [Prevotella sp. E2-28]